MIDTYAATTPTAPRALCPFSPTELDVLRRLADGDGRAKIARDVLITKKSLDTAIGRMFRRVDAANVTQLVATALREGWIR